MYFESAPMKGAPARHIRRVVDLKDFERYLIVRRHLAPKTVIATVSTIRLYLNFLTEKNLPLSQEGTEEYLYKAQTEYKKSSYNTILIKIQTLERYLKSKGTPITLTEDIKRFKLENPSFDVFTPEEVQRLLDHKLSFTYGQKGQEFYLHNLYRTMILFLAMTGCRYDEMASLKKKHLSNGYATFTETKTKKNRRVPIPKPLQLDLEPSLIKDNESLIFQNTAGKKVDCQFFNRDLKRYGEELQINNYSESLHAHMFRHTYALWMLRAKVDIITLSRLLGHENVNSTSWYLSLIDQDLDEAIMFHPMNTTGETKEFKKRKWVDYGLRLGLTVADLL